MKGIKILIAMLFVGSMAFAQSEDGKVVGQLAPVESTSPSQTGLVNKEVHGTVYMDKMCGTCVEVTVKGKTVKYAVKDMPAEFNEHGKKIIFDYVDAKSKKSCEFKWISVSNVKKQ